MKKNKIFFYKIVWFLEILIIFKIIPLIIVLVYYFFNMI